MGFDVDDGNRLPKLGLLLGCRDTGATVGLFEGVDDERRELKGIRDGCNNGTLLG